MYGGGNQGHHNQGSAADEALRQQCCPNPEESPINVQRFPYIRPHQAKMKMLYHGYYGYLCLQFIVTKSIMGLIFGLLMLWILYINYATASFCQSIFVMVIFTINAIQIFDAPFNDK